MNELKKRCLIEFWHEKNNLIKRMRVTVRVNSNGVASWVVPQKWHDLYNSTAVFLCVDRRWLVGVGHYTRSDEARFLYGSPWEHTRAYFKGRAEL